MFSMTLRIVLYWRKKKDISSQTQMTQLEWQIKTLIWLFGMTAVKQTFSLSSRGRLAEPKILILFISFFSDSESKSEAFVKVVLAFNPHADVKACSSRDAFTWRQEEENKVLYCVNVWDCPAVHLSGWAAGTELILLRSRVILIWQCEKWSALILDWDCGSGLWFCPCVELKGQRFKQDSTAF